jgi:hypothetical protein
MEKSVKGLKLQMRRDKKELRETHMRELQNVKVRFPTHAIKRVPLYIHSTQCCFHVPRLLTQVNNTIIYFLHFRSNNFNCLASELPKAASSHEIKVRLEF